MKKIQNIIINTKKGGYTGNRIWLAHKLEGVVRNKAIKPVKKKKKLDTNSTTLTQ